MSSLSERTESDSIDGGAMTVSNLIIYQWKQYVGYLQYSPYGPCHRKDSILTTGRPSSSVVAILPGGGRPAEHTPEHFPMSSEREVSPFSDLHFLIGFSDNLREVLFSNSLS